MLSLDTYGKIIRRYEGNGFITLDNDETYKCYITAVQLADGEIMASCHFSEYNNSLLLSLNRKNSITSLKGFTNLGEEFLLSGNLLYTNASIHSTQDSNTIDIIFFAGNMKYTRPRNGGFTSIRIGITNLEFVGNKLRELPNGGGAWDIFSINLEGNVIDIYEVQDYKNIMESIKNQKGVDVTSEAIITITSANDLDKILTHIDDLCKILSLARGTKINWIYYDCYDSKNEIVISSHQNRVVWQYAGLPLIDPRNPHDTVNFINQSFSTYLSLKNDLEKAIETYLDAKRETGYLEIRALRAVVVLEFLNSTYSTRKDIDIILKKCEFKKIRNSVKSLLADQLKALSLPEHLLSDMESKIGELNRRSFRTVLEIMFAEFGIVITKNELDKFINTRNSLIHKGEFVTKNAWQEYTFLISILDRVLLGMLNYTGAFLDITNNFNRVESS